MRTLAIALIIAGNALAAAPLTYEQVVQRFRANNPTLMAGQLNVQENQANEITAGLRPNPQFNLTNDQYNLFSTDPYRPLAQVQVTPQVTQLIERGHKRQLRVESARLATRGSTADQQDLERNLLFTVRDAFVRVLLGKSLVELGRENLQYYDKVIQVNRDRFQAGDIARLDLQRIELQRVQFESDLTNAEVNLRTAKIQLLALMNDRTPVDEFDIVGAFDFKETVLMPDEMHQAALDARPDLRSAATLIEKAKADNRLAWANGTADPVAGGEYLYNAGFGSTIGWLVSVPIRVFDKNQGEKERTALEIKRTERLQNALATSALRDVDSAYEQLQGVVKLLRPYRDQYLGQSLEIRDTVSFSYSHGGASLLDFLDAQKSYRDTQLAYRNLVASYLSAANQLNFAVGREVIP